jgi:lipocalin
MTFEKNGYCITADYGYVNPTCLTVTNAETIGGPTGQLISINGTAMVSDPKEPGKLKVRFDSHKFMEFHKSNYWIIALDPNYNWAGKICYTYFYNLCNILIF